jgi:hypothetical protein
MENHWRKDAWCELLYARALGPLCVCILCVLLCAGLWPFRAPKNNVEWLQGENGLRFGRHGIVASANGFGAASGRGACSLEIWLEPGRMDGSGTILSFDSSPYPSYAFALRQFDDGLAIQRGTVDAQGTIVRGWLKIDHVFEEGKRVVLTVTGGQEKTAGFITPGGVTPGSITSVYVNGARVKVSPEFGLVSGDWTGRLILGNSPINDSWMGQIGGLAVYDFELTPAQVAAHFERWTQQQAPAASGEKAPLAWYRFDEGKGGVVHDRTGSGHDLTIAARYFALHPAFLHPVWDQFRSRWDGGMSWSYWSDVLVNVAGFVPLGFFFTAYFSRAHTVSRPRILVVVLGLAISLLIEIWQHFLPTRDSSMADVITNTLGTVAGAALYRPVLRRTAGPSLRLIS